MCVEPAPPPLPPDCDETTDGVPIEDCLCNPQGGIPGPVGSDGFDCPAQNMRYCHSGRGLCKTCKPDEDANPNHFDCDDYALVCMYWMQQEGINGCHFGFVAEKDPNGQDQRVCKNCNNPLPPATSTGHAINSAQRDDTTSCLYEPQSNTEICCWTGIDPGNVPATCLNMACERIGGKPGPNCRIISIKCRDPSPLPGAGEDPFYVHPAVCDTLEEKCGIVWPDGGVADGGVNDAGV